MCVVYFSYRQDADFPLVLASNRDEYYDRPALPAHVWQEEAKHEETSQDKNLFDRALPILGGRDQKANGAWLALKADGRFGALTNYRDPKRIKKHALSRGLYIPSFLHSQKLAGDFLLSLSKEQEDSNPYNLLLGDREALYYYSSIRKEAQKLGPGLYGLSNHLLDTPWPKVCKGKRDFRKLLESHRPCEHEAFFIFLQDRQEAPEEALPDTGIGKEWERILSPRFIHSPDYGTRASTLMYIHKGEIIFLEQSYDRHAKAAERRHFCLALQSA